MASHCLLWGRVSWWPLGPRGSGWQGQTAWSCHWPLQALEPRPAPAPRHGRWAQCSLTVSSFVLCQPGRRGAMSLGCAARLLGATVPPHSSPFGGSHVHLSPPAPISEVKYEVAAPAAPKPDLPRRPHPGRAPRSRRRVQMPLRPQWPKYAHPACWARCPRQGGRFPGSGRLSGLAGSERSEGAWRRQSLACSRGSRSPPQCCPVTGRGRGRAGLGGPQERPCGRRGPWPSGCSPHLPQCCGRFVIGCPE